MELTVKERLLNSIAKKETDRLAWSPFLAYWWEQQPEEVTAQGQLAFLESIGADPLLRGFGSLYRIEDPGCEEVSTTRGSQRQTQMITPVGTLSLVHTYVAQANTWFLTEHPVKTKEDFKILAYIAQHMKLGYDPALEQQVREMGDRALMVPQISPFGKTCFQSLIEHYVGTEELVYALADYPEAVEECLEAMREPARRAAQMAAQSDMEVFLFWEDSSTTNISPELFDRYTAPEITEWAQLLHREGKLLMHHACGHIRDLLSNMCRTGIDCIESISPPPTGNVELWEAQRLTGGSVSLIGGIEPTVFSGSTKEELTDYVRQLLSRMNPRGFLLANSDSCPPDVALEKFTLVSSLVRGDQWSR